MTSVIGISQDFIRKIIAEDLKNNRTKGKIATRFPPEPNGYLHIGHAKSTCLNFGLAKEHPGGTCNLRLDDSNPTTEEVEYVESIKNDVRWLGFDWDSREYYASDYFEQIFQYAIELIKLGKAYVCSLSAEEMRKHRGTLTEPGKNSPYRNRSIEENLDLFQRMRAGEFSDGTHVLRAKIDMASSNLNLRDPALYRIRHEHHYRTGDKWCIYPMYDFCHALSDAIEGITHSICTLEFEDHRPLYDWFLESLNFPQPRPQQIEFARLNLSHTILSKRKLLQLVGEKHVSGWDDPRMPTIAGFRRRGYTPEAIRDFCEKIGVAKADNTVDISLLEFCIREDLNKRALRAMVILNPLKLVIENYPLEQTEELDATNNPEDQSMGLRKVPFSRELFIEANDFRKTPPKDFHRLAPGKEVRLMYAYYVKCTNVITDNSGKILEVHCTYDPQTKGGWSSDGRKVKGTLHWVSAKHAIKGEIRLYDHLFSKYDPDDTEEGKDFLSNINPNSVSVLRDCLLEPSLQNAKPGSHYQFVRHGYFFSDPIDSVSGKLVFNRTVGLKDSWAKIEKKG